MKILETTIEDDLKRLERDTVLKQISDWGKVAEKQAKRCPCCGTLTSPDHQRIRWEVLKGEKEGWMEDNWICRYFIECYCWSDCGTEWETDDIVTTVYPRIIRDFSGVYWHGMREVDLYHK